MSSQEGWRHDVDALDRLINLKIDAIEKRLDQRLGDSEDAVRVAFLSAEKAVAKAEVATEKRFEAVDKLRAQLAEQATVLISRNEATVRIDALSERLDADTTRLQQRVNELELRVTSRLDIAEGSKKGVSGAIATLIAVTGLVVAIVVAVVTVIATR